MEDRDPNVKRAKERRAVGDYTGALESYEKALQKRPGAARIHWDMATIYDQHLTNELRAIYHYEKYLELDPRAERRQLVEQSIGLAKLSYAVSLPDRPSEAVQENARLRKENETLGKLLTEARDELAQLRNPVSSSASTAPAVPASPEQTKRILSDSLKPAPPQTTTFDSYTVQPGDTLSRIAGKVYGDSQKWDVIFQANKATLKRPENVKVGQTLVVPR
jgi:nucleoid-associated protein YgaU